MSSTSELVMYIVGAAVATVVVCAVIAVLKTLFRCCGCGRKRRRTRVHAASPPATSCRHAAPYDHNHHHIQPPYTISRSDRTNLPTPYPSYGTTHSNMAQPYQHSGPHMSHYGPPLSQYDAHSVASAPPPPPTYAEAVDGEAYNKQAPYNPAYQHV